MAAVLTEKREMVRVKYIPTSDTYRNLKLECSINSRDMGRPERVTLIPNQWKMVSHDMLQHLKGKQKRKREGVSVPDGDNLAQRMNSSQDTTEKTRHEEIYDFELIVEGE